MRTTNFTLIGLFLLVTLITSCVNKDEVNIIDDIFSDLISKSGEEPPVPGMQGIYDLSLATTQRTLIDINQDPSFTNTPKVQYNYLCKGGICPCIGNSGNSQFNFVTPTNNSASGPASNQESINELTTKNFQDKPAIDSSLSANNSLTQEVVPPQDLIFTNMVLVKEGEEIELPKDQVLMNETIYDRYIIDVANFEDSDFPETVRFYYKTDQLLSPVYKDFPITYSDNGQHHGMFISYN